MPPGLAQHYLAAFTLLLATIIRTFLDVLSILTYILKYPFVLFLTVFVLLSLISHVVDMAAESLTPICVVFPSFPVCGVTTAAADALTWTFGNIGRKPARAQERFDFPGLMAVQSRTLDQLLARSTAGSQLALSVKHAELAVKDLGIVVRSSNLTSKDVLARSLDEFAQEAKIVGRQLQQLSAKLYGAVDTVLAFDDYALRAIMGAQAAGSDVTHTAAQMFKFTMSALSTEVARVILEATTVASRLDTLEEKLSVIRAVCEQERLIAEAAMDEVLSQLWTLVGGNKVKLQQLGKQVDILRNVDWYRSLSVAHVVATTETLLRVESELGELRDKLSAPSLAGDTIPIEVHITSIERSARRLHEDKLKARSDSNHATYGPSVSQRLKDTQLALVEAV
ncbi:hypothetical protein C8Q74DRAFT_1210495 [Fomes fomentarius]|nr:hypothetical protein C8Q74DRAFT_1210495 [Fomes fomentarius]